MKTFVARSFAALALASLANAQPTLSAAPASNPEPPSHSAPPAPPAPPLDLSPYNLAPVYSNDFSQPQKISREEDLIEKMPDGTWKRKARPPADAEWIAEGWGGAEVRDGRLRVAPSPFDAQGRPVPVPAAQRSHMVVWNQHIFPADFLAEFDMSPDGSAGGLAILLFCATGKNGEDLFDLSLPPRRADYPAYHSGAIANYTDAYWSRNTNPPGEPLTNRLRKNPGFLEVASGPSHTTGPTDVTYHVRVLKAGAHIAVEINGQVVFQWDDPGHPLGAGRLGFRSMSGVTTVSYSNLKVFQVTNKSSPNKS
ncbi:MAG: DUF1961 family protein [Opitutales bacterium]